MSGTTFARGENPLRADKLNTAFSERVWRRGDTMQGILTLWGDPINPFDAATKQYVDRITVPPQGATGPAGPAGPAGPPGPPGSMSDGGTITGPLYYIATGGNTPRSAQDRSNDHGFSVLDAGAKGDWNWMTMTGTNDQAVIQALFNNPPAGGRITFPAGRQFYVGTGLVVPTNVTLYLAGQDVSASVLPPVSSGLVCDPNRDCLTINGSTGCVVENLTCSSRATVQPTTGVGIRVNGGAWITLVRTLCYNNYESYRFDGDVIPGGIGGYMIEPFSAKIVRAHIVQKTWAELYVSGGGRLGMGPDWTTPDAHISIEGGSTTNPSSGPNSLVIGGIQCQSGSGPKSFIQFVNRTPGALQGGVSAVSIHDLVMEASDSTMTSIFHADGTWQFLERFSISGVYLNAPDAEFWDCPPGMTLLAGSIVGNSHIWLKSLTLAQTAGVSLQMACQQINVNGAISLTSNDPSSTVSMIGMEIAGNVTLAGAWRGLTIAGGSISGTLTNTATGNVNITVPNKDNNLSSTLSIGSNAATGLRGISLNTAPSNYRVMSIQSAGVIRWSLGVDDAAEGAGNAGSNFLLSTFDNAGNPLLNPLLSINRATGISTFASGSSWGGNTGANNLDLSKHLTLHTAGYGLGVTGGRLNYVAAGTAAHSFISNNVDQFSVSSLATMMQQIRNSPSYANDAAAAAGGVIPGQAYRNGSAVMVRVA